MKVLVIGSGGREHAICWKLTQSPLVSKIYAAPGNGGISTLCDCEPLDVSDHHVVINFCKSAGIDFVVVGPEAPLVDGLVDSLHEEEIKVFGPSKKAAQMEASKHFTHTICDKKNIPAAKYQEFNNAEKAKAYVEEIGLPVVIKADGLAAGKGVTIAHDQEMAFTAIDESLVEKRFGDEGNKILVEEFLEGEEVSFFAFADGQNVLALGTAQDHKALGEGDTGPNTGGMGTYSPPPVMNDALHKTIMDTIIHPLIDGIQEEGAPYKGILFAGLMITKDGPKLLEVNVRFGDPETQVLLPLLKSDLLPILMACEEGTLDQQKVAFHDQSALCVVMATKGYPEGYEKGSVIGNLETAEEDDNVVVFHAGTKYDGNQFTANGGRVLGVTGIADDVAAAQAKAYDAINNIDWPEGYYRRDIGWRAVGTPQVKAS